jgi:cold shock CspA family protein
MPTVASVSSRTIPAVPIYFLHITALQSVGLDPENLRLGEPLTFDVERSRDGRTKASNVRWSG